MNKQFNVTDDGDRTGQDATRPLVVNSDPFDDNVPLDGTFVAIDPNGEEIVYEAPVKDETNAPLLETLLNHDESEHLRLRWNEIQSRFVDDPRFAVQQAETLVSEVTEKITQMFANENGMLEGKWKQGNDVSTEELRQALQRYRSFFNRLVV